MRFVRNHLPWFVLALLALPSLVGTVGDVAANGVVRLPILSLTLCYWILTIAFWLTWRRGRRDRALMVELGLQAEAALRFANALAERHVNIPCDDCGNPMGPNDRIDVLERPDGKMYVGHATHQRAHDWGYQ